MNYTNSNAENYNKSLLNNNELNLKIAATNVNTIISYTQRG